jgi:hypothetical protein
MIIFNREALSIAGCNITIQYLENLDKLIVLAE